MTVEIERFLNSATQPLEGRTAERDEARTELMARLGHLGVPIDQLDLSGPAQRVEAASRRRRWWRRAAWAIALVVLLSGIGAVAYLQTVSLMVSQQAMQVEFRARWEYDLVGSGFRTKELRSYLDRNSSGMVSALVDAEVSLATVAEQSPANPGLLQQHLSEAPEFNYEGGIDPAEFLTAEQRLWIERNDAGNALWPLLEAKWNLEAYAQLRGANHQKAKQHYDRGWECFHRAATCAYLRDHSGALRREVVESFPPESGMVGGMARSAMSKQVRPSLGPMLLRHRYRSGPVITIGRHFAGLTSHDERAAFFEDWERVVRLILDSEQLAQLANEGLRDALVEQTREFSIRFASHAAPPGGGETELRRRADAWHHALTHLDSVASRSHVLLRSGKTMPIRMQSSFSGRPDSIPADKMMPSCRTERAMFDRILAIVGAFLWLLVAGICGFEACRRRRPTRGLAAGLMPLLDKRDWAWIVGLGCVAPWAFAAVLSFATPLGMRDWSLAEEEQALAWVIRWAAAWTLSVSLVLQTVQWRWSVRGGFLGLGSRALWAGWLVSGLAAAGFVAAGTVRWLGFTDDEELFNYLLGISGCIAIPLLWVCWFGVQNLFTPGTGALRANVVSRAMLPCCLGLGLLMLVAAGLFRWQEAHWMKRDALLPSWTSETHFNAVEQLEGEEWARLFREALGEL